MTEASFEVDRSVVLFDFVDSVEDASSELPVDDRPGLPKEFEAFVICSTNSAFILASGWAASSGLISASVVILVLVIEG